MQTFDNLNEGIYPVIIFLFRLIKRKRKSGVIEETQQQILMAWFYNYSKRQQIYFKLKSETMSVNLLEKVQQSLGYPALHKIDPNTQQLVNEENTVAEDKFSQAAIPAVLTAMYKYVQADKGAENFLRGINSPDWAAQIFQGHVKDVFRKIAEYANLPLNNTIIPRLNQIANEAEKIVKDNLPAGATVKDVKAFFNNQRNNILLYLPPALNIGDMLNDDTLDDNVNKMEGPVSSLMQSIGAAFSSPVVEEKENH